MRLGDGVAGPQRDRDRADQRQNGVVEVRGCETGEGHDGESEEGPWSDGRGLDDGDDRGEATGRTPLLSLT